MPVSTTKSVRRRRHDITYRDWEDTKWNTSLITTKSWLLSKMRGPYRRFFEIRTMTDTEGLSRYEMYHSWIEYERLVIRLWSSVIWWSSRYESNLEEVDFSISKCHNCRFRAVILRSSNACIKRISPRSCDRAPFDFPTNGLSLFAALKRKCLRSAFVVEK